VEAFPEVADALVIDLEHLGGASFLALFVVLTQAGAPEDAGARGAAPDGETAGRASRGAGPADPAATGVAPALRRRLLDGIRAQLSARHAPDEIFAVPGVPRTLSGKKMEVPVRRILLGHPPERCASRDAMANPSALEWFVDFARGRGGGATIAG
jgi:acetoacetyl-CoA synthetase